MIDNRLIDDWHYFKNKNAKRLKLSLDQVTQSRQDREFCVLGRAWLCLPQPLHLLPPQHQPSLPL